MLPYRLLRKIKDSTVSRFSNLRTHWPYVPILLSTMLRFTCTVRDISRFIILESQKNTILPGTRPLLASRRPPRRLGGCTAPWTSGGRRGRCWQTSGRPGATSRLLLTHGLAGQTAIFLHLHNSSL